MILVCKLAQDFYTLGIFGIIVCTGWEGWHLGIWHFEHSCWKWGSCREGWFPRVATSFEPQSGFGLLFTILKAALLDCQADMPRPDLDDPVLRAYLAVYKSFLGKHERGLCPKSYLKELNDIEWEERPKLVLSRPCGCAWIIHSVCKDSLQARRWFWRMHSRIFADFRLHLSGFVFIKCCIWAPGTKTLTVGFELTLLTVCRSLWRNMPYLPPVSLSLYLKMH